jgi:hypothetical protein
LLPQLTGVKRLCHVVNDGSAFGDRIGYASSYILDEIDCKSIFPLGVRTIPGGQVGFDAPVYGLA